MSSAFLSLAMDRKYLTWFSDVTFDSNLGLSCHKENTVIDLAEKCFKGQPLWCLVSCHYCDLNGRLVFVKLKEKDSM